MFADYSREFGTIHELAWNYSFGVRFGVREILAWSRGEAELCASGGQPVAAVALPQAAMTV
jgi:hypothetical protein